MFILFVVLIQSLFLPADTLMLMVLQNCGKTSFIHIYFPSNHFLISVFQYFSLLYKHNFS